MNNGEIIFWGFFSSIIILQISSLSNLYLVTSFVKNKHISKYVNLLICFSSLIASFLIDRNIFFLNRYGYYDTFFYDDDFFNNYESYNEDNDFYYYRSKRNTKSGNKASKGKIIKRKKAVKSKRNEIRKKVNKRK